MHTKTLLTAALLVVSGIAVAVAGEPRWQPIPTESLVVQPGSALDCARFVAAGPAGKDGRVIVGRDGHLAFERAPDQPVKFFGFSAHGVPECATHADVDALVAAIRMQGYNIVRTHFLDLELMSGAGEDFAMDPRKLDIFYYYVSRLKENGIYLFFDAMTSWNGYRAVTNPWNVEPENDLKQLLYYDAAARAHWERGVRQLLAAENPYTGLSLAEDPVLAVLQFFNEQEIRPGSAGMTRPWREFLKRKYGSVSALRAAWQDAGLPAADSIDQLPIYSREELHSAHTHPARAADIAEFLSSLKTELLQWYIKTIRAMGYEGLITQYDFHKALYLTPVRAPLPVVAMHNYHDHHVNDAQQQNSALGEAVNWWRILLSTRFTGRPFLATEYGQPYPNRFRYEQGLVVGGYAALQDIDLLMAHQSPVKLVPRPLRINHVGYDPVLRASEFLTGYLFMRGDVAPAPHRVNVAIDAADLANPAVRALGTMNTEQSRIVLVTGLGVSSGPFAPLPGTAPAQPDITIGPAGGAAQIVEQLFATAVDQSDGSFKLAGFVDELKQRGLLPQDNRTDPVRGVFESETGELLLDAPAGRISVRTPRLEGAAFGSLDAPLALGHLTIASCSVPACVALVAVDDRQFDASRRMVLVFATDARNTGTTFTDAMETKLADSGQLPAVVRTGILRVRIDAATARQLKAWPLRLNGGRSAPLPVRAADGALELVIDTAGLPDGPAVFFELAVD